MNSAHEERKLVSVVFVDLVGFTARSEQNDPEDVRALQREYFTCARREVERFGGTLEKFAGDAVMAVFGAPLAHEDDAERAVRAAVAIVDAVGRLETPAGPAGLAARAGVATGEAIVDLGARPVAGESIVTGDVVNTAARLQQLSPPEAVVVGESTHRTTDDLFEYDALAPAVVKGKAAAVPLWIVRGVREAEEAHPTSPFIGREADLALLEHALTRTLRERSPQLVTVAGEPGVGKTRLVAELRAGAATQDGLVWRQGRCLPYGEGITFWALGEIVKEHCGILTSDGTDEAAAKLIAAVESAAADRAEHEWLAAALAPLIGAPTPSGVGVDERTETAFTAWRRFLELVAAARPLALVLEDLHWADDALLAFVEHVVDWATGVPLLVIVTARPELYERRPGWGGGKRNSTTVNLSPLSAAETGQLLSALLAAAVLPTETEAALLERAGGNPLYAEEFARMLTDRGILLRRNGGAEIAPGADIEVPETIQALIAARLDTLSRGWKGLLHDASVVGKVFWSGALAAIGGRHEDEVREGLHELAGKEFVRPARDSSVAGEEEYSFWHVLVRDVAYGQIPRAERARKHVAAARWIEQVGERVTDRAELLAHHYVSALALGRATGADTTRLEPLARRFLVLAGERALQLDVGRAHVYYRQALDLLAAADPDRPRLLSRTAEADWLAGRLPEAERAYAEAIAGFRTQGDVLGAGEAMVALVASLRDRGETQRARKLLEEAVELLEQEPPGKELALAYLHAARDDAVAGRAEAAIESSQRALDLAGRLGLQDHVARALQFRGGGRVYTGDLGGVEDLRRSLELSLELGLGYYTVNSYGNLAEQIWRIEGPAPAMELYRDGVAFGSRRGIAFKTRWIQAESLWALYDLGSWDELIASADEILAWDDAYGGSQIGIFALSYRARVLAARGHLAEAAANQQRFLPAARASGDRQVLVPALAIAALTELARGASSAAQALLVEYDDATRGYAAWRAHELPDAARVAVAVGAEALVEAAVADADRWLPRDRCCVATAKAVLADAAGRVDEAAVLYRQAADAWEHFGGAVELAHALLGAGRCVRSAGGAGEAVPLLERARDAFVALAAEPRIAETQALLEAVTADSH
jgi:class 3 adenylate cyclase/tetratricopeptide (TPR) repeat protein